MKKTIKRGFNEIFQKSLIFSIAGFLAMLLCAQSIHAQITIDPLWETDYTGNTVGMGLVSGNESIPFNNTTSGAYQIHFIETGDYSLSNLSFTYNGVVNNGANKHLNAGANFLNFTYQIPNTAPHCGKANVKVEFRSTGGVLIDEVTFHIMASTKYPLPNYEQDGFLGAVLYMKDNANDIGREPNTDSDDPNVADWADYFRSDDLWVRRSVSSGPHENPDNPTLPGSGDFNYVYGRVWNIGCAASDPAELELRWTRARPGELWRSHWYHYSTATGSANSFRDINNIKRPLGGEITISDPADYTSSSDLLSIPSIAAATSTNVSSYTTYQPWVVPQKSWYQTGSPGSFSSAGHPIICLLARIISTNDPIHEETYDVDILDYVKLNKEVVTRNTHITDDPSFIVTPGNGTWNTGWGTIALQANVPSSYINLVFEGIQSPAPANSFNDYGNIYLAIDANLYAEWEGTVTGATDEGGGLFLVTDPSSVLITDIPIDTGVLFTAGIKFEYIEEDLDGFEHYYEFGLTQQIISGGDTSYGSGILFYATVPV